jgi:hypothetical protein
VRQVQPNVLMTLQIYFRSTRDHRTFQPHIRQQMAPAAAIGNACAQSSIDREIHHRARRTCRRPTECLDPRSGEVAQGWTVGGSVRSQPVIEGSWIYVGTGRLQWKWASTPHPGRYVSRPRRRLLRNRRRRWRWQRLLGWRSLALQGVGHRVGEQAVDRVWHPPAPPGRSAPRYRMMLAW